MTGLRQRYEDEGGFAGGLAGLLFGLLIFLLGSFLVAYAWAVVQTKAAVVDASRQAARTYVEAPAAADAYAAARQAALVSLGSRGRDPGRARVDLISGGFGRCERITIAVSYPAPAMVVPLIHLLGGSTVTGRHSEIVDPYRSGVPGIARCA